VGGAALVPKTTLERLFGNDFCSSSGTGNDEEKVRSLSFSAGVFVRCRMTG
jgi:hypothetical protein